jgi:hypothetical protein
MGRDSHERYILHNAIVANPLQEATPCRIADGLRKDVVLDHIGDLEIFKSNQVVRRDQRVCRFPSKIFTLPLNFEIRLAEFLPNLCPMR